MGSLVSNSERNIILNRALSVTPTLTAPYSIQFSTNTTQPTVGDTSLANSINNTFQLDSITTNTTNYEVVIVGKCPAGDGNTGTISKFATWNNDSTPLICTIGTWTGNTKTSAKEFKVTIKNRVRSST